MPRFATPEQVYREECHKVDQALRRVQGHQERVRQKEERLQSAQRWRQEALEHGATIKSGMELVLLSCNAQHPADSMCDSTDKDRRRYVRKYEDILEEAKYDERQARRDHQRSKDELRAAFQRFMAHQVCAK